MGARFGVLFGRGTGVIGDDGYEREAHVLESLGIPWAVVSLDDVVGGAVDEAVSRLPERPQAWVYRGWLLPVDCYEELYEALYDRGQWLVTTPAQFEAAALIPEWVPELGDDTPATIWTEDDDADEAWELAMDELGPPPWLIKDHLKSARQLWNHACFVPEGTGLERFREMCAALVDFHEDRFTGGLAVRRFVRLVKLPWVSQGHPVFDEHRLVFWNGRLVGHAPYHDVDVDFLVDVPFTDLGKRVDSPFFTADIGRLEDGGFTVIELNDGGTSGLPAQIDPWEVYGAMLADPP